MTPDDLWFADNPSRRYRLREATRPEADAVRAGMGHKERSAALGFLGADRRAGRNGHHIRVDGLEWALRFRMIRTTPLRNT